MKRALWLGAGLVLVLSLVSGCGRVRMPWTKPPHAKIADPRTSKPPTSPIPKQPWFEAGSKEARVRIVAFFPMDDARKPVMDLLKGLAKEYDGRVYVKFTDVRTREGMAAQQRAHVQSFGLLINSQSEITIDAKPQPYTVNFNQDMGRYWTADDLKAAVAQEVARAYGK